MVARFRWAKSLVANVAKSPAGFVVVRVGISVTGPGTAAVPLASVRQPRHEIGRAAATLVLAESQAPDEHEHRHVVFTPELVVRESSRRPRQPRRVRWP